MVAEEIVEITLETDFSQFSPDARYLKNEKENISFLSANGKNLRLSLKVELRGVFRRRKCGMPPLKFNFYKKDLEQLRVNSDFDKLKNGRYLEVWNLIVYNYKCFVFK